MPQSFRQISAQLARQIKLVMTDVDGTITSQEAADPAVSQAIRLLEEHGIMVGLVSGRTLPRLDRMARSLGVSGPLIAENGGVARLKADSGLLELGYSRQPALDALRKLQTRYPEAIKELPDNADRLIDLVIHSDGVAVSELRKHLEETLFPGQGTPQLLDSGYMLHLMQSGISKGKTLLNLIDKLAFDDLTSDNVITFGDSLTDMSLFEFFPNCVLILNPKLTPQHSEELEKIAGYVSEHSVEEGFIEVVSHIIDARTTDTG